MGRRANPDAQCHKLRRGVTNDTVTIKNIGGMYEYSWQQGLKMSGKAFNLREYLTDFCNRRSVKDENRYKVIIGEEEKKEIADKLLISVPSLNRAIEELVTKEYLYKIGTARYVLNFPLCGFTGSNIWKEYHKLRLDVLRGKVVDSNLIKGKFDEAIKTDNQSSNFINKQI